MDQRVSENALPQPRKARRADAPADGGTRQARHLSSGTLRNGLLSGSRATKSQAAKP